MILMDCLKNIFCSLFILVLLYGLQNGISIPLHLSDQGMAGASLIYRGSQERFKVLLEYRLKQTKNILKLFHCAIQQREINQHFVVPLLPQLDLLQRKVLKLLCQGYSNQEIASTLNYSDKYIKKKLSEVYELFKLVNHGNQIENISRDELMHLMGMYNFLE